MNVTNGDQYWGNHHMFGELVMTSAGATGHQIATNGKDTGSDVAQLISLQPSSTGSSSVQNVSWTNLVGVTGSGNNLTKTVGEAWGNSGAVSTQSIASGNGYVEFTASETNTYRMCGLSHADTDQGWWSIGFAMYTSADGYLHVYESGVYRGTFEPYATGDHLRVAIEGGVVKYSRNGVVFYTSTITPTYPMLVDTALYSPGSTINNVVISNGASGTSANLNWLVADQLGTPRMIFDQSGSLTVVDQNGNSVRGMKRHDYLPFGEELFAGTGGRTTAQGYVGDNNRFKFTTYERDAETGLDYAQARYYSNTQGRFTSPDPTLVSLRATNPQTMNRYAYVLNNPLRYVDPLGLWELDYETKRKKNGEIDKVIIHIKKSKEGDNATTLAKQLGYDPNSKEGAKMIGKIDKVLAGGDSLQGSKLGGIVGRVFGAAEHGLTAQAKFAVSNPQEAARRGPSDSQYNDCSMTTCRIAFPGQMIGSEGAGNFANFGVQQADDIISRLKSVPVDALRTGDIVRYGDAQNTPTHFMNAIFTGDDGTTKAFSRSGVNGRFEIIPVDAFNGTNYGTIRGRSGKDTGFYRP